AWYFGAEGTATQVIILYTDGFLVAGVGMLFMMVAFRYGEVSFLQPMMSLSFALSILLGTLFLNVMITWYKLIGTGL
ncbi:EamA family transporter, partial [Enterococcus faecalis]|uniref:EamA family transporter n=1 Tax=Enterococcus faecalis TaxID=1351 RepID=UPI003CC56BBA